MRRALEIREATMDPDGADVAVVRYHLGMCALELGRPGAAETLLDSALPPLETRFGIDRDFVIEGREALERARALQGSPPV